MKILSRYSSCSLSAISKVSTSNPNMIIMTTVLGCPTLSPLSPVLVSAWQEGGGGRGAGGRQEGEGGTGGGKDARYDRDTMGSDVMGRSG